MSHLVALLIAFGLVSEPRAVSQNQPDLMIGPTLVQGSVVLDLATTTPGVSLFQAFAFAFRDVALAKKADTEIAALLKIISSSLDGGFNGYLLRANVFSNEFGNLEIPGGQMLVLVEAGSDPVDALARYFGASRMEAQRPLGKIDSSSFVWLTRREGRLVARTIPGEFRDQLMELGKAESDRRKLAAAFQKSFTEDTVASFRAAEYWKHVELERSTDIRDQARRDEVRQLTLSMAQLEDRGRKIQMEYAEKEKEMASYAQRRQALEALQAVTAIVSDAMSSGALRSTNGKDVPVAGAASAPFRSERVELDLVRSMSKQTEGALVILDQQLKVVRTSADKIDATLTSTYKAQGVQLPPRK